MKNNLTYLNFTQNVPSLQLHVNFDVDTQILKDSKVEATANRYTFVWRKSVEKFQKD